MPASTIPPELTSTQELAGLTINLVDSQTDFNAMSADNMIQPNEFYLIQNDDYTFSSGNNGTFTVNGGASGLQTINVGTISGGIAPSTAPTVIGGVLPTGTNGYTLQATTKTLNGGAGVVVTGIDANNIAIALSTVTSNSAVGPTSNIQLGHGDNFIVPYIDYDEYGRITSTANRTYTLPLKSQMQAVALSSTYAPTSEGYYFVSGISVSGDNIQVAKRQLVSTGDGAVTISSTTSTLGVNLKSIALTTSSATADLAFGETLVVPTVTRDAYGRVTGITSTTYTLPTETRLTGGSADEDNLNIVTGIVGANHILSVAKKTLTAGSGITLSHDQSAHTITIGINSSAAAGSYGPDITGTNTSPTTVNFGTNFAVPYITVDSVGRVTGASTKYYKIPSESTLSISSNSGITNCELINSVVVNNHAITVTKSKVVAGLTIAVASEQDASGQYNIKISHGSTGAATGITAGTNAFIKGITLDAFGHVTGISTAAESTGANLNIDDPSTNDGSVITKITLSGGHNENIAITRREIAAGDAITVSTATAGKIIINHADTSEAVTIASAAGKFVTAISVDGYGHVKSMSSTSVGISAANGSAADVSATVLGGISANGLEISVAKKTISGINGITVTPVSNTGISIGISSVNVAAVSSTAALSHGGTFSVPSTVAVNSLGQVTSITNTQYTLPTETQLEGGVGDDGKIITAITLGGTANHTLNISKRTIAAGSAITVSTSTAGQIIVAHSDTSSQASQSYGSGNFVSVVSLDAHGHITKLASAAETELTGGGGGTANDYTFISGISFNGTHNHNIQVATKTIAVDSGALSIAINSNTHVVTLAHKDTSTVTNLTASERTYLTGLTFDDYGHVTGYTTGTEAATINSGTTNGIAYYSNANTLTSLGPGAVDTVLVFSGNNATPQFKPAFGALSIGSGANSNIISASVAGIDKSITLPIVNNGADGGQYGTDVRFATVKADGKMEVGRYIDLHAAGNTTRDFDVRLDATDSTTARIFTFNKTTGGEFVTHTAATAQGSATNPVYVDSTGAVSAIAYNINANVGVGTANHMAYYATNIGIGAYNSTVGSHTKPMFLNSGVPTAISGTVGAANTPIFLNSGELTASNSTIGSHINGVFLNSGVITPMSGTIGAANKPMFLNNGTFTASNANIGSKLQPIYMDGGVLTATTETVGAHSQGVFLSGGNIFPMSATIGTEFKPVYLSSGTITVGAYELKSTVNNGTTGKMTYYSGDNAISAYTDTIGAQNKPIFISSGVPTAFSGNIGSNILPIYIEDGILKTISYPINATIGAGTQNRLAYYTGDNAIGAGTSIYTNGSSMTIGGTSAPSNDASFQVIGNSITRSIYPEATANYQLGTQNNAWTYLYLSSSIYFGLDQTTKSNEIYFKNSLLDPFLLGGIEFGELDPNNEGEIMFYITADPMGDIAGDFNTGLLIGQNKLFWQGLDVFTAVDYAAPSKGTAKKIAYYSNANTINSSSNLSFTTTGAYSTSSDTEIQFSSNGHIYAPKALVTGNYGTAAPTSVTAQWGNGSLYFQYV